eukprot:scaffold5221_cov122-Isochrysis_galbana.AAC.2
MSPPIRYRVVSQRRGPPPPQNIRISPSHATAGPLLRCCGRGGGGSCHACGQFGSGRLVRPSTLSLTSGAP